MAIGERFQQEIVVMRTKRIEQTALTTFLIASCVTLLLAAFAAQAHNRLVLPAEPSVVSANHNI